MQICNSQEGLAYGLAFFLYSIIELWLGKTAKIKYGSVLEIFIAILVFFVTYFWRRFHGRLDYHNDK